MAMVTAVRSRIVHRALTAAFSGAAALAALLLNPSASQAQEANACLSPDPTDWPAPSKPYFMLLVDTSGSMIDCTNPPDLQYQFPNSCPSTAPRNSCNMEPTRINDAKCALRQTVQAFAGEVNFGLATFAAFLSSCGAGACVDSCTNADGSCNPPVGVGTKGEFYPGNGCVISGFSSSSGGDACGNNPNCASGPGPAVPNFAENTWHNGGSIVVPLLQDPTWANPQGSNVPELLKWFDGKCDDSKELFAIGGTPMAGALQSVQQYLASGWNPLWSNSNYCASGFTTPFATPITSQDRACRSINVILVTDGDPSCGDSLAQTQAAASALFNTGVTFGGNNFKVRTYVINFAGGVQANTDLIAQSGGTGASLSANNETQLSSALATIISSAIKPEVCNNADDNCNGCTDEGYRKFCNRGKTPVADPTQTGQCCQWTTTVQRDACLARYKASITSSKPNGDLFELPCWNPATDASSPQTKWLCVDPGEICDNADNNCDAPCAETSPNTFTCGFQNLNSPPNTIDESFNKCGSPLACPVAEVCDGRDNDCDNVVDNAPGSIVPFSLPNCLHCVPTAEICDGCDNDCDGDVDEGIAPVPCGFSPPAQCAGQRTCDPVLGAVAPNTNACLDSTYPKSRLNACNAVGGTETCNGLDDDCDGLIDNNIPPAACEVPGMPGLVYQDTFAQSQCKKGLLPCGGQCSGFVGPSPEICDGIDNDCDGVVDEGLTGLGQACGLATGQCQKGTTACVGGTLVCQGGRQPQPEICNGVDDDCDGDPDEGLIDAPTNPACWNNPPSGCSPVCQYPSPAIVGAPAPLQWCPPAGATCTTTGTLTTPCATGTLVCGGTSGWRCSGAKAPTAEVCDAVDNDCNGTPDDGLGSPVGDPCGTDVGECHKGTNECQDGVIRCVGGQGPVPEVCNGLDDDCNTYPDDGISVGGTCFPTIDVQQYPNADPTKGQCRPGVEVCDGTGGSVCSGGVGPSPELCDTKDNDCDGQVDEAGPQPGGVDGTADPLDSTKVIGQPCGSNEGECKQGKWVCSGGRVVCAGGIGAQPEKCDCLDNDCDGKADEEPTADSGGSPLCSAGKICVQVTAGLCQCAARCGPPEFPCPVGFECKNVIVSGTGEPALGRCVNDPCGDCSTKTVVDPTTQQTVCAPNDPLLPPCVCKGALGCRHPCADVTCDAGQACVLQGPAAGSCQPIDNCYFHGCADGEACKSGVCVDDPCIPDPCSDPTAPVCKPNSDFNDHRCVASCAGVSCAAGEKCVEGQCVDTGCGMDCPTGEVCKPVGDAGFACGPSECTVAPYCADGAYCDPATGDCGTYPCEAVVCPGSQVCREGECVEAPATGGTGGMAGSGGSGAVGGSVATGGTSGSGGASGGRSSGSDAGKPQERGVFGLATGGGGCACRASATDGRAGTAGLGLLLLVVGAAFARSARRRRASADLLPLKSSDATTSASSRSDARDVGGAA